MLTPVPPKASKDRTVNGGMPHTTHVALDGTYTLDHVVPGDYVMIALLPGYLSLMDELVARRDPNAKDDNDQLLRELAGRDPISISAQGSTRHDLVLNRGAAVSGRVLYPDGAPASQVLIVLENIKAVQTETSRGNPADDSAMMRMIYLHQSNGTDDLGHFRLNGVTPGTYRIAIVQSALGDDSEGGIGFLGMGGSARTLRVYAGDTTHRKQAKTYELRGGDEFTGVEITLPINIFHTVSGQLTAPDGRIVNMGALTLTDTADDGLVLSATIAHDGTFRFPAVPSGTYKLTGKDLFIGASEARWDEVPERYRRLTPSTAFAEASTTLLVKDSDLSSVTVPLTEKPLPPPPSKTSTTVTLDD